MVVGTVVYLIVVPHQSRQIHMLLRRLNGLSEQLLEATMISKDDKVVAQETLSPLLHGGGDGA